MLLGVDYYPEHWDEAMIDEDLENIVELGANAIRIGEFAWCRMEKEEGVFDFSIFDKTIQKAKKKQLKIMFGTPTATQPAWLCEKYPDICAVGENGLPRSFGGRRTYCFNNEKYYTYSKRIITALISHYKEEESIIAWQIDNEFGHEGSDVCFCEHCKRKFQDYLKEKYRTIEVLNETYGTIFWSQEYNNFSQVPLPLPTITTHNPSLRMDWELFRSKSIEQYAAFQVKLIKKSIPHAVVLHDFSGGGLVKHFDLSKVAKSIDQVAYNNYPVWGGQKEPVPPYDIAFNLSYIRGLKQQNFWITEAIMGAQGHDITGYLPRPNQAKMWSYQAMAHGCIALFYFRYRSATKGAEQFCYGILDADNIKRRKFYEVQSFFKDIKQYKEVLESPIKNEVCIITDYQSRASLRIQQQSIYLDYEAELKKLYKTFHDQQIGVDILPEDADFTGYKLVLIPLMTVWYKSFQDKVKDYVKSGGTVLFTYRTAVKDCYNNVTFGKVLPTHYDDLIGGYIFETESLQEYDSIPLKAVDVTLKENMKAGIFREFIQPITAQTLFRYDDKFYDTYAGITENQYGKGRVFYVGTSLIEEDLRYLIDYVIEKVGIVGEKAPDGLEIVKRTTKKGKDYHFLMNHTDEEKSYRELKIAPYGVEIVDRLEGV